MKGKHFVAHLDGKPVLLVLTVFLLALGLAWPAAAASEGSSKEIITEPYFTFIDNTTTGIRLEWSLSPEADGYHLYRSLEGKSKLTRLRVLRKGSITAFIDRSAQAGKTYRYLIRAYKKLGGGKIARSSYDTYGASITRLLRPTLTTLKDGRGYVYLKWNKIAGAKGYILYRTLGKEGEEETLEVIPNSSTVSFKDYTVEEDTNYTYYLLAYNGYSRSLVSKKKAIRHQKERSSSHEEDEVVYRAVLIGEGVYNYPYYDLNNSSNDSSDNLYGPANDVYSMGVVLKNCGYSSVLTRKTVRQSQLLASIRSGFFGADDNDISLFFYSGHGSTSSDEASGALELLDDDVLKLDDLASALAQVPGKVIVILDSCGSGAAIRDDSTSKGKTSSGTTVSSEAFHRCVIRAFTQAKATRRDKSMALAVKDKFYVLTSSQPLQTSTDIRIGKYHGGALTRGFVEGAGYAFRSKTYSGSTPADGNGDGEVTLEEAFRYAWKAVRKLTNGNQVIMRYPVGSSLVLYQKP